jgi:hypothetical protein
MLSWTYLPVVLSVPAVHDLSIFVLLFVARDNMIVIASCEQQHRNFDSCMGVVLVLPLHSLLLLSLLTIEHKEMIVASSTFASWHHDQNYCWRFVPLRLLIWVIQINEKGWLSQAQSHVLIAINPCCLL